jgi:hypothetical protein
MLFALGALVLRSILPCHDGAMQGADSIDSLIAGTLCASGQLLNLSGDLPGVPAPDAAPACLHCATGCTMGTAALAAAWILVLVGSIGGPSARDPAYAARRRWHWPGELARGPPLAG